MKKLFLIFLMGLLPLSAPGEERWELELYYKVDCPHCQKVIRFMNRCGIAFPLFDTQREPALEEMLLCQTGMDQVPCLMINGRPLFESDDIITWLEANILD